jgi:alkaline phosphatase D
VDARVRAQVHESAVGPGVVLRRVGPHTAYAAVFDAANGSFDLLARDGVDERVLASRPVAPIAGEVAVELTTVGTDPTTLHGALHAGSGTLATASATDDTDALQRAGDPGVLSTAESGLTPDPDPPPGSLEQFRLLGVADGSIRYTDLDRPYDLSTSVFEEIEISTGVESEPTPPAVVAASARRPTPDGFAVRVVSDLPASVAVETAPAASFETSTTTDIGEIGGGKGTDFRTALGTVPAPGGETVHWRPVLERNGMTTRGAAKRVAIPPSPGEDGAFSLVVGACGTQFSRTFHTIAGLDPDVFVWEGDINYPDAMGAVAQTMSGYAGLWKALLRTPELDELVGSTHMAFSRDDHDYGRNDVSDVSQYPYGVEPFEHVLEPDPYFTFGGGPLDVWVLDTRKWRDPHEQADTPAKTLLGGDQLDWLIDGITTSTAPFKLVCSPGPVFNVPNDSYSWAKGYTAEREQLLSVIDEDVDGEVVFVTGDTHSGCVTRDRGILEVRAAPLAMPAPAYHGTSSGENVEFTDDGNFFCHLQASGTGTDATFDVALHYGDGEVAWETQLSAGD